MRKILICGLPRTKTTVLQLHLSSAFGLTCLSESYTIDHIKKIGDPYRWTQTQDYCIIKLLTTNLISTPDLEFKRLWDCGFDHLILTIRNNMTDTAVSLYYAGFVSRKYHYQTNQQIVHQPFRVDIKWLEHWYREMLMWHNIQNTIKELKIPHDVVDYNSYSPSSDMMLSGINIPRECHDTIPYIDTAINYQTLCKNYQEVKQGIENYQQSYLDPYKFNPIDPSNN